tara:strand:- start:43 stop:1011 length:969 start_codon:yes stop_codon:yes gene_type:complete
MTIMSDSPAFEQNIVALIWDFDKTLITGYMQAPLFKKLNVDSAQFWGEVRQLGDYYKAQGIQVNPDSIYLNHLLTYIRSGPLKGLNNKTIKDLGSELEFYPGLPTFFPHIQEMIAKDTEFSKYGIKVEHYIVSTGFAAMIRGCDLVEHVSGIWGCEFIEDPALPGFTNQPFPTESKGTITQIGTALDNTSKTRALFEINKGASHYDHIDVNSKVNSDNRRVPFENMIYIADGPSDVPAFSIVNQYGGRTYAIYPPKDQAAFRQVDTLRQDGRINMFGEANYEEGSPTYMWLMDHTRQIAERIVREREDIIRRSASQPPKHLA